ncbi:UBP1-associated protein 2B-like [Primulina eburnea]|uniref:UBP1-associated protein 2B-like n=1 Tax=Primulina eburnea TaxID=1245227 RepID=UPI003C6C2BB3
MAKKRKSRAIETPQEPEPEPEPGPEPIQDSEPDPEQYSEPDPEQSVTEEIKQTSVEDPSVGEEEEEEADIEEEAEEVREGEGEGEEEEEEGEEVQEDDALLEKIEQEYEITEKPSENDISENGGANEGQNEEDEGELEEEPLEKLLEPFSKDQIVLLVKEAVAKHPDIIDNVRELADADPSHRKIFVHGLGWDATSETITSVFGKYGDIEDSRVVIDKNSGKAKGYGFILFRHRHGARRALKQPQKLIGSRMTSCQLASAGPVPAPPPIAGSTVSGAPVNEYTQKKIYVSNVSAEIDVNKLVEFFSKFGEIEEGPLGLDKQTGKPRGFCLFVYKSTESAKKALEEPHKKFEGQILHCQKAIDGPKHSKGYFNPQHGQPHQQQSQPLVHHQGQQGYYQRTVKRGKYAESSGGMLHTSGHLMAPSAGPAVPPMTFNHPVPPAAIGQAVAALLATQGAGLGIGNLLGGIGTGVNPQGGQTMMNNVGYGVPGASGYGGQSVVQGGYGVQPPMGQGGVRPHQGAAPYMGHGH